MLVCFLVPLAFAFPLRALLRVYFAGLSCGLMHHAALFFWGMRGYTDAATLAATVTTEWPALVAGVFACTALVQGCMRRAPKWARPTILGAGALASVGVAACLATADLEAAIADLLPYLPG